MEVKPLKFLKQKQSEMRTQKLDLIVLIKESFNKSWQKKDGNRYILQIHQNPV
jgi:hypothetical protein